MKSLYYLTTFLFLVVTTNAFSQNIDARPYLTALNDNIETSTTHDAKAPIYTLEVKNNFLKIKNGKGKLIIRTVTGQIIKQSTISNNDLISIDITNLKAGKYIIHIIHPNGIVSTEKFKK